MFNSLHSNFSVMLIGINSITIQSKGYIEGARLSLCTNSLTNYGHINSDKFGCSNNNGIGTPIRDN